MAQDQALMNKSEVKVIGALKRQGKFASAQSVYQLLRKDGESTGLATVYRTHCKKLLLEIQLMFCAKMMVRRSIAYVKQAITIT